MDGSHLLQGRRILVVEDEMMIAMLVEDMLGELGCTVIGPAHAIEPAMALAGEAREIDAAVLDINLAGQPVFAIADLLRSKGVPVIFSSGYGESGLREVDRGAQVLQKPFRAKELEAALNAALKPA